MKRPSLSAAVQSAAARRAAVAAPAKPAGRYAGTRMVGASFHPRVSKALKQLQLLPENEGKTMRDLLGEAINELCLKYRQAEPWEPEEREVR